MADNDTPLSAQQIAALESKYVQRFQDHICSISLRQWAVEKAVGALSAAGDPFCIVEQARESGDLTAVPSPQKIHFAVVTVAREIYDFLTEAPTEPPAEK